VRLCGIVGNNSNFFLNYLSLSSPSQKKLEPSSSLEVSTRDYVLDAEHIAVAADTMRMMKEVSRWRLLHEDEFYRMSKL
jgi:hypothetical protein